MLVSGQFKFLTPEKGPPTATVYKALWAQLKGGHFGDGNKTDNVCTDVQPRSVRATIVAVERQ